MFTPNNVNITSLLIFNLVVGIGSLFILTPANILISLGLYFFLATLFNVGIHRYFSHTAYKTSKFWHNFFNVTSFLTLAGSPISFTTAHLPHHKYTDRDKDPVGKSIGFWKSFFFMFNLNKDNVIRTPKRLIEDKVGCFVHRFYMLLFISFYAGIYIIDTSLCLMYSLACVPLILMYAMTNYTSHETGYLNYRNFNTNDNSQNNIIHGLLGSEWHNNHHKYPGAWNQSFKWWEIDTSSWVIRMIKCE